MTSISIEAAVLDEISLEGLEGITYETLWIRLEQRVRFLTETLDYVAADRKSDLILFSFDELENNSFRDFIFKLTLKFAKEEKIAFYKLPKPRPIVQLFNRNKKYKEDSGTIYYDEEDVPPDPYQPMVVVSDGEIRGSCGDYNKRKNITNEIFDHRFTSLTNFKSTFPITNTIVLVANAINRSIALFGPYKWRQFLDIRNETYVLLEAIGRKRNYGELNYHNEALQFEDVKIRSSYHKYRAFLQEHNLIVGHRLHFYSIHRKQVNSANVFYLARFRPVLLNQLDIRMEELMNYFVQQKKATLPIEIILSVSHCKQSKLLRRQLNRFPGIFNVEMVDENVDKTNKGKKGSSFNITFLKPLDRKYTVTSLYDLKECDNSEMDEIKVINEDDDDSEQVMGYFTDNWDIFNLELLPLPSSDGTIIKSNNIDLDRWRCELKCINDHFITRIYQLIRATEDRGISTNQLMAFCDIPTLEMRHVINTLMKKGRIINKIIQKGRSKINIFMAQNIRPLFEGESWPNLNRHLSDRFLERCQFLLEYLRQELVVNDLQHLRRYMLDKEAHLGYSIDVRTSIRILSYLAETGSIQFYTYRLQSIVSKLARNIYFAFLKPPEDDGKLIEMFHDHFLLRFKFELFFTHPVDLKLGVQAIEQVETDLETEAGDITSEIIEFEPLHPVQQVAMSNTHGYYRSKIDRAIELYRFLFLLLTPKPNKSIDETKEKDYRDKLPELWRFFHDDKCSFFDFVIYLPLCLICKLCPIRYNVPGLQDLLNDPRTSNQLVYEVQPSVRQYLFHGRKAFTDLYEILNTMSYLGLVTISDSKSKRRNTSMIYFKRTIKFENSLKVKDGEPVTYHFESEADIQTFVDDIYFHLVNLNCKAKLKMAETVKNTNENTLSNNVKCPFDPRLNIHYVPITGVKLKKKFNLFDESNHSSSKRKTLSGGDSQTRSKRLRTSIFSLKKKETKSKKLKESRSILSTRSRWSLAEDQFLVKCRLASALIDNSFRYVVCVSRNALQELLFKHLGIKKLATSIARRLLQLNHKPLIKQLIRSCLLELEWIDIEKLTEEINNSDNGHDDSVVVVGGGGGGDGSDETPNEIEAKNQLFTKVLEMIVHYDFRNTEYFLTKDQLKHRQERIELESKDETCKLTYEEIISNYEIINPSVEEKKHYFNADPKNFYDIHSYVIANILISSLLTMKFNHYFHGESESMSFRWSFLRIIFKSLKRYPEMLVNLVVKRLIQMEIISKNKKNFTGSQQRFNCYAYKITNLFFLKLVKSSIQFDDIELSRLYCDDVDPLNMATKGLIEIKDINTMFSTLQFMETFALHTFGMEYQKCRGSPNSIDQDNETAAPKFNFHLEIPETFHRIVSNSNRNITTMVDRKKRSSFSRSSILQRKQTGGEDEKSPLSIFRISPDDLQITHCKVKITISFPDPVISSKVTETLKRLTLVLDKNYFEKITGSNAEDCIDEYDFDHYELFDDNIPVLIIGHEKAKKLIEFVKGKKQFGAKLGELANLLNIEPKTLLVENEILIEDGKDGCLAEDRLLHFLRFCEMKHILFSVGIVERTWVHRSHLRYWLVHSYENFEFEESSITTPSKMTEVRFLPKVWKQPEGRLHLDTLFVYFSNILGSLCFKKVNHEESALLEYFQSIIPPVQLTELLDILLEIGSLKRKLTLWPEVDIYVPKSFDQFFMTHEELATIHSSTTNKIEKKVIVSFEPTVDCYVRLAIFYKQLASQY